MRPSALEPDRRITVAPGLLSGGQRLQRLVVGERGRCGRDDGRLFVEHRELECSQPRGSASMSIATIFPRVTVQPITETGSSVREVTRAPAVPFTSTGRADRANRVNVSALSATVRAPWSTLDGPGPVVPVSARSTILS